MRMASRELYHGVGNRKRAHLAVAKRGIRSLSERVKKIYPTALGESGVIAKDLGGLEQRRRLGSGRISYQGERIRSLSLNFLCCLSV